jgi:hypothetical protein
LRSDQDLPVYQVVPSVRAPVTHAARYNIISPINTMTSLLVAARTPVYLRINTTVTRNAARLTYGLPGSALTVRGSHPLDD